LPICELKRKKGYLTFSIEGFSWHGLISESVIAQGFLYGKLNKKGKLTGIKLIKLSCLSLLLPHNKLERLSVVSTLRKEQFLWINLGVLRCEVLYLGKLRPYSQG